MRFKGALIGLATVATLAGGGWLIRQRLAMTPRIPSVAAGQAATDRLFANVFATVRSHAVDSLDDQTLYRMAAVGVLSEVGDPYATLLPGRDSGVTERLGDPPVQGLYLDQPDGFVEVVAVVPGSPAALAGVRPGDAVLRVDETRIELERADHVGRLIEGKSGSTVKLRLGRDGGPVWVTVTRASTTDARTTVVAPLGIGMTSVTVARIDSAAAATVGQVVDSLSKTATRGLVLDLRGVVEGRLVDAVRLVEPLLGGNQKVVTTRAKNPADSMVFRAARRPSNAELPIVVLVDRATAGAAEVVAGALQDHDRVAVVGETTFGRGATLSLFPLEGDSTLRLTTSLWVTPSGRVIQRLPVPPPPDGASPDSTSPRPSYQTDAGRKVLGGGGIVPDREIAVGKEPSQAQDLAMATAIDLLTRAKSRTALLAAATPK